MAITPYEAEETIKARVVRQPATPMPLEQCIGQTLRQDVYAERDNPPFDRVCMDGIALASAAFRSGVRTYRIEATQAAGSPAMSVSQPEAAIEVMTGAIMPNGTDCVIPLEEYDLVDASASLHTGVRAEAYRNVQRRGSDSQPGVPMLRDGMRLGAAEIAVAASAGLAQLQVTRQPRIVAISTGDELIEPGQPIAAHQVRRSNVYAVVAALRQHGFRDVSHDHLLDEETMLKARLAQHLSERDVLILSGGVSKGKFDLVPKALKALAVAEVFYQVAQRPGMPMWFGIGPGGQAVFGLPGNPVSTLICLVRNVLPALTTALGAASGAPEPVALGEGGKFGRAMTYFLPVEVRHDALGGVAAWPRVPNGSGDFLALAGTDGFLELPPRNDAFPAGFVAPLYRW
ncbi:MAG TPA: molybdopterin molybdotransferase MoeA [Candidatus Dormibacteraeota bacterium]|nr:molybdopterin molybdotransferase MoeA [Candidatus Dormibacteraeota bacterium]